jgi:hypothetical protein
VPEDVVVMSDLAETVERLQVILISMATGGGDADRWEYEDLRSEILSHPLLRDIAPQLLRKNRKPEEF